MEAASSSRALRQVRGQQGLPVSVALGVEVNDDLGRREALAERMLDALQRCMGLLHGPVRRNPDVELDEAMRSGMAGAQVVEAGELGIFLGSGEEGLALGLRPFAVH